MKRLFVAALASGMLALAPAAFAQESRDALIRTEAQIQALDPADATAAAPAAFAEAQLRLNEAKAAEDKNDRDDSMHRSSEAALNVEIVQERIKLRGLERTVSEIETGIATLRRELNS